MLNWSLYGVLTGPQLNSPRVSVMAQINGLDNGYRLLASILVLRPYNYDISNFDLILGYFVDKIVTLSQGS